jgi:hypothetical protein
MIRPASNHRKPHHFKRASVVIIATAFWGCGGRENTAESIPLDQALADTPAITMVGCVEPAEGGTWRLRVVDTPGSEAGGSSTTAGGAWLGSRIYELESGNGDLAQHAAKRVTVTGQVQTSQSSTPGTDQEQSAYGVRFMTFRAASMQPATGPCPQAAGNTHERPAPHVAPGAEGH